MSRRHRGGGVPTQPSDSISPVVPGGGVRDCCMCQGGSKSHIAIRCHFCERHFHLTCLRLPNVPNVSRWWCRACKQLPESGAWSITAFETSTGSEQLERQKMKLQQAEMRQQIAKAKATVAAAASVQVNNRHNNNNSDDSQSDEAHKPESKEEEEEGGDDDQDEVSPAPTEIPAGESDPSIATNRKGKRNTRGRSAANRRKATPTDMTDSNHIEIHDDSPIPVEPVARSNDDDGDGDAADSDDCVEEESKSDNDDNTHPAPRTRRSSATAAANKIKSSAASASSAKRKRNSHQVSDDDDDEDDDDPYESNDEGDEYHDQRHRRSNHHPSGDDDDDADPLEFESTSKRKSRRTSGKSAPSSPPAPTRSLRSRRPSQGAYFVDDADADDVFDDDPPIAPASSKSRKRSQPTSTTPAQEEVATPNIPATTTTTTTTKNTRKRRSNADESTDTHVETQRGKKKSTANATPQQAVPTPPTPPAPPAPAASASVSITLPPTSSGFFSHPIVGSSIVTIPPLSSSSSSSLQTDLLDPSNDDLTPSQRAAKDAQLKAANMKLEIRKIKERMELEKQLKRDAISMRQREMAAKIDANKSLADTNAQTANPLTAPAPAAPVRAPLAAPSVVTGSTPPKPLVGGPVPLSTKPRTAAAAGATSIDAHPKDATPPDASAILATQTHMARTKLIELFNATEIGRQMHQQTTHEEKTHGRTKAPPMTEHKTNKKSDLPDSSSSSSRSTSLSTLVDSIVSSLLLKTGPSGFTGSFRFLFQNLQRSSWIIEKVLKGEMTSMNLIQMRPSDFDSDMDRQRKEQTREEDLKQHFKPPSPKKSELVESPWRETESQVEQLGLLKSQRIGIAASSSSSSDEANGPPPLDYRPSAEATLNALNGRQRDVIVLDAEANTQTTIPTTTPQTTTIRSANSPSARATILLTDSPPNSPPPPAVESIDVDVSSPLLSPLSPLSPSSPHPFSTSSSDVPLWVGSFKFGPQNLFVRAMSLDAVPPSQDEIDVWRALPKVTKIERRLSTSASMSILSKHARRARIGTPLRSLLTVAQLVARFPERTGSSGSGVGVVGSHPLERCVEQHSQLHRCAVVTWENSNRTNVTTQQHRFFEGHIIRTQSGGIHNARDLTRLFDATFIDGEYYLCVAILDRPNIPTATSTPGPMTSATTPRPTPTQTHTPTLTYPPITPPPPPPPPPSSSSVASHSPPPSPAWRPATGPALSDPDAMSSVGSNSNSNVPPHAFAGAIPPTLNPMPRVDQPTMRGPMRSQNMYSLPTPPAPTPTPMQTASQPKPYDFVPYSQPYQPYTPAAPITQAPQPQPQPVYSQPPYQLPPPPPPPPPQQQPQQQPHASLPMPPHASQPYGYTYPAPPAPTPAQAPYPSYPPQPMQQHTQPQHTQQHQLPPPPHPQQHHQQHQHQQQQQQYQHPQPQSQPVHDYRPYSGVGPLSAAVPTPMPVQSPDRPRPSDLQSQSQVHPDRRNFFPSSHTASDPDSHRSRSPIRSDTFRRSRSPHRRPSSPGLTGPMRARRSSPPRGNRGRSRSPQYEHRRRSRSRSRSRSPRGRRGYSPPGRRGYSPPRRFRSRSRSRSPVHRDFDRPRPVGPIRDDRSRQIDSRHPRREERRSPSPQHRQYHGAGPMHQPAQHYQQQHQPQPPQQQQQAAPSGWPANPPHRTTPNMPSYNYPR